MSTEYRRPSGIYAVRIYIPERLQPYFKKRELHITTGCRDFRVAKIIAAELKARWHRTLHLLAKMSPDKIKQFVPELIGQGYISALDVARLFDSTPERVVQMLGSGQYDFYVQPSLVEGWFIQEPELDIGWDYEEGFRQISIVENLLDAKYPLAQPKEILKFYFSEFVENFSTSCSSQDAPLVFCTANNREIFVVKRYMKELTVEDILFKRSDVEHFRCSMVSRLAYENKPEISSSSIQTVPKNIKPNVDAEVVLLSTVVSGYLKVNQQANKWKIDQYERREQQGLIMVALLGDVPVGSLKRSDLRRLVEEISKIPHARNLVKNKYKLGDVGIKELIDFAEKKKLKTISPGEQKKIIEGVDAILEWAKKESYIDKNPAEGLAQEVKKVLAVKPQEERCELSVEILQQLFSLPWFVHGVGAKTTYGRYHEYAPYYYWLPLLGLYTGGRLNELCQLQLTDFKKTKNGTAYIEITIEDESGNLVDKKSIKTKNSKRSIPVHQRLIDLGLLDYCDALRAADHEQLFPELSFDMRKGYGKAAGRWFNERLLGNKLQIQRDGRYTFHSLRHNFATALSKTSIESTLKADLMGHQRSNTLVELRYEKGVSPDELKKYVNEISYELPVIGAFNVVEGLQAVKDALKRKR